MSRITNVNVAPRAKLYSPEVKRWNEVMANAPLPTDTAEQIIAKIKRQSAFVIEEANEIAEGAAKGDVQEILDGYLDTKFVNDQIGVYLEALGIDLQAAWDEVVRSNNTKFSTELLAMYNSANLLSKGDVKVRVVESPVSGTFVLKRDFDGKIMKPTMFEEPQLRRFIPKPLRNQKEYV